MTGQPDPTITPDFLVEMRMRCQDSNRTATHPSSSSMASLEISESAVGDVIFAGIVIFNIIWGRFWHSLLSELFKGERTPFFQSAIDG